MDNDQGPWKIADPSSGKAFKIIGKSYIYFYLQKNRIFFLISIFSTIHTIKIHIKIQFISI